MELICSKYSWVFQNFLIKFYNKNCIFLAISVILSLLARLHNILDDNSNREINGEHMNQWPTSVTKYVK